MTTKANKKTVTSTAKKASELFTVSGHVIATLKDRFGLAFSSHKAKVNIEAPENDAEALKNLNKAEEIIKAVLELDSPITPKYLKDMLLEQEKKSFVPDFSKKLEDMSPEELLLLSVYKEEEASKKARQPKLVTSKVKVKAEKKDPSYQEIHLKGLAATQSLFNADNIKWVHAVQKIFDVKAAHMDGTRISIRPAGKVSRQKADITRNNLLVSQAGVLLTTLTEMIVDGADKNITNEVIAKLALEQTIGQENEEKTLKKVKTFLGEPLIKSFIENLHLQNEQAAEVPTTVQKAVKRETTDSIVTIQSKDFGKSLDENKALTRMLETKLKVGIEFKDSATTKEIKIHKRANSRLNIALAENVIAYAHDEYMKEVNSLDATYFENLIDNALNDRPLDFIDEAKEVDIKTSMRRDAYKLNTYNPSADENYLMYPRTEAQYELYDMFLGKPTNKRKSSETVFGQDAKTIVIAIGPAASGKTSWATFMAVHAFKSGASKKLYLVRPALAVGGGTPAHLPGGIREKTAPALMPLYENLKKVMPEEEMAKFLVEATAPGAAGTALAVKKLNDGREIEICDIERLRGRTLEGILLADEMQNATDEQTKMLFGRIGPKSRAYISYDLAQIDFRNKRDSGAPKAIIALYNAIQSGRAPSIGMVACNGNLRSPVVAEVLSAYEIFENNGAEIAKKNLTVEDHVTRARPLLLTSGDNANKNDITQDKHRNNQSSAEHDMKINMTPEQLLKKSGANIQTPVGNA